MGVFAKIYVFPLGIFNLRNLKGNGNTMIVTGPTSFSCITSLPEYTTLHNNVGSPDAYCFRSTVNSDTLLLSRAVFTHYIVGKYEISDAA